MTDGNDTNAALSMHETKTQCLLKLVPWLQSSRGGVTIEEIRTHFDVGDRTARRWIAEIESAFPHEIDSTDPDGTGKKYWRLRPPMDGTHFATLTPEDVNALETAASIFEQDNRTDLARGLRNIRNLSNAHIARAKSNPSAFENDVSDLVEAEGLVMRPGPRIRIEPKIMSQLRAAIQKYERIRIQYGKVERVVEPYGFLYGKKHYLVAFLGRKREPEPRLLILTDIHGVEPLGEVFERRKGFDLRSYAAQSFGAFHGDTVSVQWKFSAKVADEVRQYVFHPTQKMETKRDGCVVVSFRASGQLEMACHLLGWGGDVEVVKPVHLRALVVELGDKASAANRAVSLRYSDLNLSN
jgi:predicted DNA-binding transcriptional regulator YafY